MSGEIECREQAATPTSVDRDDSTLPLLVTHSTSVNGLTCSAPPLQSLMIDEYSPRPPSASPTTLRVLVSPGRQPSHVSAFSGSDPLYTPQSSTAPSSKSGQSDARMRFAQFQGLYSGSSSTVGSPLPAWGHRSTAVLSAAGEYSLAGDLRLSNAVIECDDDAALESSMMKSGSAALAGMQLPDECSACDTTRSTFPPTAFALESSRQHFHSNTNRHTNSMFMVPVSRCADASALDSSAIDGPQRGAPTLGVINTIEPPGAVSDLLL